MTKFVLLILISWVYTAHAEYYELFKKYSNGVILPHPFYNDVAPKLKEGDIVSFSNGKTVRLGKRLDNLADETMRGTRTLIFELIDNPELVIRIPNRYEHREGIDQTIRGYDELEFLDKSITKIKDGIAHEFVIVERLPRHTISFQEMILDKTLSESLKVRMITSLVRLAKKTSHFSDIHDFNYTQFTYSPTLNEWILFDWGDEHYYLIENGKISTPGNIWDYVFHILIDGDPALYGEIPELTNEEKDQVRKIREMLFEVTEKERAQSIKNYNEIKPNSKCNILMNHFF